MALSLRNKPYREVARVAFWQLLKGGREPFRFLFVLSHMRSGSTLTSQVLNTHPEITGFSESMISYHNEKELRNLVIHVARRYGKYRLNEAFVMDKINHNSLTPDHSILKGSNIQVVFLLRDSKRTMESLVRFNHKMPGLYDTTSEQASLNYYCERLKGLEELAAGFESPHRPLFITYEDLTKDTNRSLVALQKWLCVDTPFAADYHYDERTALSREIINRSGKIQSDIRRHQVTVSEESLLIAREAHATCFETLTQHCLTVKDYCEPN